MARQPTRAWMLLLWLLPLLCWGAATPASTTEPDTGSSTLEAAAPWLTRYRDLAASQPAHCAPVQIPSVSAGLRSGVVALPGLAGKRRAEPGILFSRDPIVERFVVIAQAADGCVQVGYAGRLFGFIEQPVVSPLAHARIPAAIGETPPVALIEDAKAIRPWVAELPESDFRAAAARHWTLLGAYSAMLAVLLLVGLGFFGWRRDPFALAYVFYLAALQFYQLQALGLGPACLPFWPAPEHARLMQSLAIAAVVSGTAAVVMTFLRPRGRLLWVMIGGVAVTSAAFLAAAWTSWGYRVGALNLAWLSMLTLVLLAKQLPDSDASFRWFAAGLGASMLGGGLQALSILAPQLPDALSVAFPVGNLVESFCWLVALTLHFRSEHAADQSALRTLAYRDPMTHLPNRHWLREQVTNALKQVERHPRKEQQLLLADLDEFRAVNSCCGHAGGDQVLRSFGELLRDALEPGEVVGRFGGDAFMLLLRPGRNPSDAEGRASAILARLKDPFHCGGRPIQLRASIGIAAIRPGYVDADAVIADAELARETARAQGGHRAVRFQPQLRSASRGRIQLREELAESLRTQRFELHFQPVVSLDTGRPIGFEVLVRWRSLTRGLVPAAEFIGVAAEVGMVRLVGYRVLRLALEQLWRWQRGGVWYSGEYLSINLSAEQLGDGRLLEEINAGLHRHGIDPSALRFEIPEAALADETPEVRAWRERLLGQRVQVCLDGFGGERTPLSSLADMAFDCIKLDASLTAGVTHQGRAQNLIQTGIALGEQLGCLVIAKGIECREQRLALQRLGCLYGQGHELARPMSADDLAPWVTLWQAEHRAATHLDASPRTH